MENKPEICELCGRSDSYLNFHHLIPKTLHSKKWYKANYEKEFLTSHGVWCCKYDCHYNIHQLVSEKELGMIYNTKEKLLAHPEVHKYIEWRKKH